MIKYLPSGKEDKDRNSNGGKFSKNIADYIEIIKKTKSLSRELELEYIKKAKKNPKYKERLFEAHYGMVLGIAHKYGKYNEIFEDLIQEGMRGLQHALKKFKPTMKVRFNTYARYWVRAYILKHFNDNVRGIRVPEAAALKLYKINQIIENLSNKLSREPTNEEIAQSCDFDPEFIKWLRKFLIPHVAIDSKIVNQDGRPFLPLGND